MDSDLAWVNGKSGRQSWRYRADTFQRSIISEAIYHFYLPQFFYVNSNTGCSGMPKRMQYDEHQMTQTQDGMNTRVLNK